MPDSFAKEDFSTIVLYDDKAPTITTADKLRMEANLLSSGIKQGFTERAKDAWDNKAATAIEFGTAALIGAGLTAMHQAGGRWGAAAKLASYGLAGYAIGDVASRLAPTAMAMHDTWNDPSKFDASHAVIANRLGSAFFDYPLMAAGGLAGSAAVARFTPFSRPAQFDPRAIEMFGETNLRPSNINLGSRGIDSLQQLQKILPMSYRLERTTNIMMPVVPMSTTEIKAHKLNFDPTILRKK